MTPGGSGIQTTSYTQRTKMCQGQSTQKKSGDRLMSPLMTGIPIIGFCRPLVLGRWVYHLREPMGFDTFLPSGPTGEPKISRIESANHFEKTFEEKHMANIEYISPTWNMYAYIYIYHQLELPSDKVTSISSNFSRCLTSPLWNSFHFGHPLSHHFQSLERSKCNKISCDESFEQCS